VRSRSWTSSLVVGGAAPIEGTHPHPGASQGSAGQLVVTLPAVMRTVTHCGFGPAKPG